MHDPFSVPSFMTSGDEMVRFVSAVGSQARNPCADGRPIKIQAQLRCDIQKVFLRHPNLSLQRQNRAKIQHHEAAVLLAERRARIQPSDEDGLNAYLEFGEV